MGPYNGRAGGHSRRLRPLSPRGPSRAGRPAGGEIGGPVAKLFAVYQFGWRDRAEATSPLGDGHQAPTIALIGLCRDQAKADRIAARIRRTGRRALELGLRPNEPLIGRGPYDPFQFILLADRDRVSRAEAHRRAVAGVVARRAELGVH